MTTTNQILNAKLTQGARVKFNGDIANPAGSGVIASVEPCEWYGLSITVRFDEDSRVEYETGESRYEVTVTPSAFVAGNALRPRFELVD